MKFKALLILIFIFNIASYKDVEDEKEIIPLFVESPMYYENEIPTEKVIDPRRDLLARVIFSEACGERKTGMIAVGCVIRNRVESNSREFGRGTYRSVILKKWQFSCANGKGSKLWNKSLNPERLSILNKRSYDEALEIAGNILSGKQKDTTNKAVFYMTHRASGKTKWLLKGLRASKITYLKDISGHRFYRYSMKARK